MEDFGTYITPPSSVHPSKLDRRIGICYPEGAQPGVSYIDILPVWNHAIAGSTIVDESVDLTCRVHEQPVGFEVPIEIDQINSGSVAPSLAWKYNCPILWTREPLPKAAVRSCGQVSLAPISEAGNASQLNKDAPIGTSISIYVRNMNQVNRVAI